MVDAGAEAETPGRWDPVLLRVQAMLYFLAVAGVFIGGYQLTLRHASQLSVRADTWTWLDAWVPFWPWSIVPYSSIDLVYPLAFLVCWRPRALRCLSIRLLAVQGLAFACFWLFPFHMQRALPQTLGLPGQLYGWLDLFDQPSNLLPSLHVAVLGVLWWTLLTYVPTRFRPLWHAWAGAVCISALTTWQHHLLDVLAGALLAWAVLVITRRLESSR